MIRGQDPLEILNKEGALMDTSKNPLQDEANRDLDAIAQVIARIPDVSPPETLLEAVMAGIHTKRIGLFRRLLRALRSPMTSITVTPLRLASLAVSAAALVIITWAVIMNFSSNPNIETMLEVKSEATVPVVFTLEMPQVSRVDIIGSFNGWSPGDSHMQWDPNLHLWVLTVQLKAGTHEYAFLINGKTVLPDPSALAYREDGFGNRNSVLIINRDMNNGSHI
jgi:hypothetical protein